MKLFLLLLAVYSLILNRASKEMKTEENPFVPSSETIEKKPVNDPPETGTPLNTAGKAEPARFAGFALYHKRYEKAVSRSSTPVN